MPKKETKNIPLAGVIGCPIKHSQSPRLHNYWLRTYKIDGYYIPLHIEAEDFYGAVRELPKMGFRGVNVTLPHKNLAAEVADFSTPEVEALGVANTLTFDEDQKIYAQNTDIYGFLKNLHERAPNLTIKGRSVAVLGAGGASRAVIFALLHEGAREIRLSNRTYQRAEEMGDVFGNKIRLYDWAAADEMLFGCDLVVNTTSIGMEGEDFPLSLEGVGKETVVTDIVYTPLETVFLRKAAKRGAVSVDGLGMLLYQAAIGFEAWFGRHPEVDKATRTHILNAL